MTGSRSTSTSSLYAGRGQLVRPPTCSSSATPARAAAPPARRRENTTATPQGRRLRWVVLAALVCALSILLVLASSLTSQAATPDALAARYRPTGPAPRYTPCLPAASSADAGYIPANGCVSGLPLDAALAHLARQDAQDAAAGGEAAAQASHVRSPGTQHPGARHPEAVLYEIRDGARQILVIDLWCLPTVRKPVGVRILC